jgi:Kef-type K+ transport system membrane component KefB
MLEALFSPALLLSTEGEGWKIPFAMLVVFGTAKLMAELFERLGQPGLSGEILAGVLIGPSVLGWMAPSSFLDALSTLGTMFLLFRVGLEVKSSELLRVGGTATLVATLGVICPFALGWGIMTVYGQSMISSVFVGAAMVATSVGITAQVLSARGLLHELSSKIILAAAVIDDVQGLLVLAVVSSVAKGKLQIAEITITTVLAVGFTVIVAKWGVKVVCIILPAIHRRLRVGEAEFILAMLFLFVLSLAAVWIGVAAIVGAFLAGMALAESVSQRERYLVHGVAELLVPFFLVGIGMKVDLAIFREWPVLRLAILLLIAAAVTKFVGCGLGAIRLGGTEAIRVGVGMIPRGEVGMVVAQLGLGMGAISPMIYSVVVFMSVATTMIAPPLIKLAFAGVGNENGHAPAAAA